MDSRLRGNDFLVSPGVRSEVILGYEERATVSGIYYEVE
jgi:hypothetical protein